jgi:hypothetical protein
LAVELVVEHLPSSQRVGDGHHLRIAAVGTFASGRRAALDEEISIAMRREQNYFHHGGILQFVLRHLLAV